MSKANRSLNTAVRIVFVILLAFLTLAGVLFLIFFVPIITYLIWNDQTRIAELEKKVSAMEGQKETGVDSKAH